MSETEQTADVPEQPGSGSSGLPVAKVVPAQRTGALFLQSKMWWITLLCLALAVWLAWSSLPETGPLITIRFPEGHGLKAGDSLRYRGISVGEVISVALNERLCDVDVRVMLKPEGGRLNRQGTRFWIERPQLSLTKVSGLETVVGPKYIGVSPGDPGADESCCFDGLPLPPPDELSAGGLQLVLRSEHRHGLNVGAPVSWRGVDVGQVLSVGLSPDARHVQTSIRIGGGFRRLVRRGTKFWVTSGFGVDLGLSGLTLNAESLTTIVNGGVSFISPDAAGDAMVRDGHVFSLSKEPDEEWLKQAAHVPLIDFPLPTTVSLQYEKSTSFLGISRSQKVTVTGLVIDDPDGTTLLTVEIPGSHSDAELVLPLTLLVPDGGGIVIEAIRREDCGRSETGMQKLPVSFESDVPRVLPSSFRVPSVPEECLVVRSAGTFSRPVPLIHAIDSEQLTEDNTTWTVTDTDEGLTLWHGAPVISIRDGKIIGMLLNGDKGPYVAPYVDSWRSGDEQPDAE